MAIAPGTFTPYTTGAPLFGTKPTWLTNDLDIMRIQSYQLYEQIYWTAPDVFKVQLRGTNDLTIYIPSARTIVDTTNRYTGADFQLRFSDANSGATSGGDVDLARAAFTAFFRREKFRSKYGGAKRYGIMRGDWIWHITADPQKPEGSRLSIVALDPAMYFPITDDNDVDSVIGCHLVEQISTDDGNRIHRLTYRKEMGADGITPTGFITMEEALFELNKWEGPDDKPVQVIQQPTRMPPQITALPVYHVKNFEEPGNPFGSSEIRGFERLMSGIDQTVSDEDLTLALQGIGMYMTDAPRPTDASGTELPWSLGPGQVVEVPEGNTFSRVGGVDKVTPFGDHYNRLRDALMEASSTPDIAIGRVDNTVISGVALALQLSPLLAKASEKNDAIIDVHNNMAYDLLNGWFPAYEGQTFNNVLVECTVGSAVPIDRAAKQAELDSMLQGKVIDAAFYRSEMTKLGYVFPDNIQASIDAASAQDAANQASAFGTDRTTAELDNTGTDNGS